METEQFYNVENILDYKKVRGKALYLIKWEGYSEYENSWEPASNLPADLIELFERKFFRKGKTLMSSDDEDASSTEESASEKIYKSNSEPDADDMEKTLIITEMPLEETPCDTPTTTTDAVKMEIDTAETQMNAVDQPQVNKMSKKETKKKYHLDKMRVEEIIGFTSRSDKLFLLVRFADVDSPLLISNGKMRKHFPQVLIDYYESKMSLSDNEENEE